MRNGGYVNETCVPSDKTDICDLWYSILNSFDNRSTCIKSGRNEISGIVA